MTDDRDAAWLPTEAYDAWLVILGGRPLDGTRPRLDVRPAAGLVDRSPRRGQAGERARSRPRPLLAARPAPRRAARAGRACPRVRCSPRAPACPPCSSGCTGCARAVPQPASRRRRPRSPRPRSSASPGSTGSPRSVVRWSRDATRCPGWRSCCPPRSTTCCCRPTSPRSRRARWSRSWPAGSRSWPTSSRGAAPPSTASPPTRCAARSTPGGRPRRCTTSSGRPRARRCRRR